MFFPESSSASSVLVLPRSRRGFQTRWRRQLRRFMTHASCACQSSPSLSPLKHTHTHSFFLHFRYCSSNLTIKALRELPQQIHQFLLKSVKIRFNLGFSSHLVQTLFPMGERELHNDWRGLSQVIRLLEGLIFKNLKYSVDNYEVAAALREVKVPSVPARAAPTCSSAPWIYPPPSLFFFFFRRGELTWKSSPSRRSHRYAVAE